MSVFDRVTHRAFRFALFLAWISLIGTECLAETGGDPKRIAHAGGGYRGETYTNSLSAFDENLGNGFEFFEVDLSWTSDNHLVCIHDWGPAFKRSFGFETREAPTLETYRFLVRNASRFDKCTLENLLVWMEKNPTAFLVTDIKDRNLEALELIARVFPDFRARVIPQIYQPKEYGFVRRLGYEKIIWTLYKYRGPPRLVLTLAERMKLYAVAMPKSLALKGFARPLDALGIPTYVHTVNEPEEYETFVALGIEEIYTDFLKP